MIIFAFQSQIAPKFVSQDVLRVNAQCFLIKPFCPVKMPLLCKDTTSQGAGLR